MSNQNFFNQLTEVKWVRVKWENKSPFKTITKTLGESMDRGGMCEDRTKMFNEFFNPNSTATIRTYSNGRIIEFTNAHIRELFVPETDLEQYVNGYFKSWDF